MGAGGRNASCYSVGPNEPYRSSRTCRRLEGGLLFVVYDLHYTTPLFSPSKGHAMLWKRTCLRAASSEAIIAVSIVTFVSGDANTVINGVLVPVIAYTAAALLLAKCGAKIVRHFVDIFDGLTDLIQAAVRTLRTWRRCMDSACPEPDEASSPNKGPIMTSPTLPGCPNPRLHRCKV